MKFKCKICGKQFDEKYAYENHLSRKTPCDKVIEPDPDALFSCIHCGRSFSRKDTLNRHYKTCKMVGSKHSLTRRPVIKEIEEPDWESADTSIDDNEKDYIKKEEDDEKEDIKSIVHKKITHYVYLLQEREFIKTNENIYKIGRSEKENNKRFNQYPNGSILLFQIICINCVKMESEIIKKFKEKFIQRKDIGREYFEGDYKTMINFIYRMVKNEDST